MRKTTERRTVCLQSQADSASLSFIYIYYCYTCEEIALLYINSLEAYADLDGVRALNLQEKILTALIVCSIS